MQSFQRTVEDSHSQDHKASGSLSCSLSEHNPQWHTLKVLVTESFSPQWHTLKVLVTELEKVLAHSGIPRKVIVTESVSPPWHSLESFSYRKF